MLHTNEDGSLEIKKILIKTINMFDNNNKRKKGNRPGSERDLWRKEYKNQDEFDYDRYVYGEEDAW